ncbi:ABC transporter permease [Primorskyibacter marinus]|uniref:ABC transporter permease n=1 Tax=Primorskyibacter marinus TaxID=1977320 RepID=UPI000E303B2F|nr:FtsX-like permease family protein [Primorskyibacter marinus]
MRMPVAFRLAARELRGGLRGFRVFLACLALGVAAIAAVGSVRAAIQAGLSEQGAVILGGDAELRLTYRDANPAELAWMRDISTDRSKVIEFRSMAVVAGPDEDERALTQVKAIDNAYPLLGTPELDPAMPLADALDGDGANPGAVMAPVLAARLGLEAGDSFRLGTQAFTLSALLTVEPDAGSAGFSLGPRTIVRAEALETSGLLAPGTLFETNYRLILPPGSDLDSLKQAAQQRFADSGLRWRDARNGAPGVARFVDRLGAFLVLVGLSGLAVGGVGVSAAVRSYLSAKTGVIATLRTLGAGRAVIFQTYFLQIGALSLLGIAIGLVLGASLPLLLAPIISASLPVPADFSLHLSPLVEAAIYGMLTALLFTLWPLARTEDVRAATLFRDALGQAKLLPRPRYLLATALLLAVLLGTAVAFSGNAFLTLWTAAGIMGALLVLALAAQGVRHLARASGALSRGRPVLRWALSAIGGPGEAAASVMISLGLGLSVLAAVGQIDGNLRNAIDGELPEIAPSYFFVDIQQDQMPGFLDRVENDPAVSRVATAPMLRGVLTRINGQPARDVAGNHWVVRGDRGLTYAQDLPDNTTLTAGEWWAPDYDGPPLVSFAAEEAEEIGLNLGDTITVNVLGRDIDATIASFREVDFSTMGIGFVMTLNPAALQGAPHSFISTVYAEEAAETPILRDLAQAYPNITAIRVRDAIDQVGTLLIAIANATRWGAAATLLTGLLVLIGAAAAGERARSFEAALLKTLGASRGRILRSFALRSALLGAGAGIVAVIAGGLGAWGVLTFVMETDFTFLPGNALTIVIGGGALTLVSGLVFALRPMAASPARVLRSRE